MNVEIGTEAAQFLFWDYLFQMFDIVSLQCTIIILTVYLNNCVYLHMLNPFFIRIKRTLLSSIHKTYFFLLIAQSFEFGIPPESDSGASSVPDRYQDPNLAGWKTGSNGTVSLKMVKTSANFSVFSACSIVTENPQIFPDSFDNKNLTISF
jgi:hypothetical protein